MHPHQKSNWQPPTWLFVGDFLFYLRLFARQLASFSAQDEASKNMVIVPQPDMVWRELAGGRCEVIILDCVEVSEVELEFLRSVQKFHPKVRRVVVSAVLGNELEAKLMEAGAELCFRKPRSIDESQAVHHLLGALVGRSQMSAAVRFRGLRPSRYVQLLCARGETGRFAMRTPAGEAALALEAGKIVDASLGELQGDAAASAILALPGAEACRFQHEQTTRGHTVKLATHQLWLDSAKIEASPAPPATAVQAAPPRAMRSILEELDARDCHEFTVQLDAA